MRKRLILRFFLVLTLLISTRFAWSQTGLCPPNLDFEFGDFTNWECRSGNLSVPITSWAIGQQPNRHTIITSTTAGTDFYGGFPELCPNGSGYSVKLGNAQGGALGESISYTYTIPSTLTVFSMMFHYAVVLQDPNHNVTQQPRFRARITDLSTNQPIPCVTFDFTASQTALTGFVVSPVSPPNGVVIYKDWTPVTMNLSEYIGRTIQLEFITSDCTLNAHFGYAYVDVNTNCNGAIEGSTICEGETAITLNAPYGFQSYQWYSDNTFTTLLATTQSLPMNPAPSVGTVIPVIVSPFPGFGCRDTLYATITVSPKPISRAGPDLTICKFGQIQIGAPPVPAHTYEWTPTNMVSNPILANPFAWNNPPNPQQFIVKTTDILTGCFSYDTTIVSSASVDTAIRATGNTSYCIGANPPVLSVNPNSATIQWFESGNLLAGQTSATFTPPGPGSYWARLTQGGCTDSTASVAITVHPLPQASFTASADTGCITNNSFQFTNTSTVSGTATLNHNWKFSDGSSYQTTDVTKSFNVRGRYDVEMETTTSNGCKDTAYYTVYVLPNGNADFTFDSICANRPVLFRNLSNENGSSQVSYNWNFNNGGPPVLIKDPAPVTYPAGGQFTVSLEMTTLGCESDPVTISKPINVNEAVPAVRYRDITVPQGSSTFIRVRDIAGGIYTWRPQLQLSAYNSKFAEFYATSPNDIRYYIDIVDKHSCVTTDTMLVQVLKKPGFYLPTAFTPNGDGLNDVVKPYLIGMKALKSFSIFNRWGDRLFLSTKYGEAWDGKYGGVPQNAGVYVWILEFFDPNDKVIVEKGTLTIIR